MTDDTRLILDRLDKQARRDGLHRIATAGFVLPLMAALVFSVHVAVNPAMVTAGDQSSVPAVERANVLAEKVEVKNRKLDELRTLLDTCRESVWSDPRCGVSQSPGSLVFVNQPTNNDQDDSDDSDDSDDNQTRPPDLPGSPPKTVPPPKPNPNPVGEIIKDTTTTVRQSVGAANRLITDTVKAANTDGRDH